jgi:hypothetical protein
MDLFPKSSLQVLWESSDKGAKSCIYGFRIGKNFGHFRIQQNYHSILCNAARESIWLSFRVIEMVLGLDIFGAAVASLIGRFLHSLFVLSAWANAH